MLDELVIPGSELWLFSEVSPVATTLRWRFSGSGTCMSTASADTVPQLWLFSIMQLDMCFVEWLVFSFKGPAVLVKERCVGCGCSARSGDRLPVAGRFGI